MVSEGKMMEMFDLVERYGSDDTLSAIAIMQGWIEGMMEYEKEVYFSGEQVQRILGGIDEVRRNEGGTRR